MKPYFITCKEAMEARLLLQVRLGARARRGGGSHTAVMVTQRWQSHSSGSHSAPFAHSSRTGSTLWRMMRCTRCRT